MIHTIVCHILILWGAPNGGRQEKIQYPERYKNATGERLWSGKDNEVSQAHIDIWRNINIIDSWQG